MKMPLRICKSCDVAYEPRAGNQKCCSLTCSKREKDRYQAEYTLKRRLSKRKVFCKCIMCLKSFEKRKGQNKYCCVCSKISHKNDQIRHNASRLKVGYPLKACIVCGLLFRTTSSNCKSCKFCTKILRRKVKQKYKTRQHQIKSTLALVTVGKALQNIERGKP